MKFRTEIEISPVPYPIDYRSKIFGLGSCFVDHIQKKLDLYLFPNKINSFGVIFNPYSIQNILERIVYKKYFKEEELFFHEKRWKSFELHSSFNQLNKEILIEKVNQEIEDSHRFLKEADWVFFTFGTAWVYRLKKTGKIVSNCHKMPQKEFEKYLLSPIEIKNIFQQIIDLVQQIAPPAKILFTISPVRHLKDGFMENQRSKARLIDAVQDRINDKDIFYFPSYEILMDDLRDYRFYKKDLVHPNEMAVDYIWEKFSDALIDHSIKKDMKIIQSINKYMGHKAFIGKKEYSEKIQEKINYIRQKYPDIYTKIKKI